MVRITCEIRSALQELEDREQFCCISHFSNMFLCRNGLLIVSYPFAQLSPGCSLRIRVHWISRRIVFQRSSKMHVVRL
jgi:hypothetical protein